MREKTNKKLKVKRKNKKNTKIITNSVLKITTLFIFVAVIAMLYQNSMTNNILADNNRQRAQEKLETVKGSKLKIGDYVNYDHTLQVDTNTKETISVPKNKLTYTSIKGDLDNSGNGYGRQTVDVSGYKTKWRVYDIQGDQVLLMPETQPTAKIATKSALGYLWYEKEAHNIAGLYGHGYGADETKEFNYEVGSRIPSERDTRTETKKGTGARPMLLKDIEEAYRITTDEQRQELSDWEDKNRYPLGSNKLAYSICYPTLNKTNARATEDTTFSNATGDIGVSKTAKKLSDIKQEYYGVMDKLNQLHTKTYDANTGKDIQKEIIHKYYNQFGSRSVSVDRQNVIFYRGGVGTGAFGSGDTFFGNGILSGFNSYDGSVRPRPVVFLSSTNNYYKEEVTGEYATYSLIKDEAESVVVPKINNPYNLSLSGTKLKVKDSDKIVYEKNLESLDGIIDIANMTRADGTKVIDNPTYTIEGLPTNIAYEINKKANKLDINIYPKTLKIYANINKKDIYTGAKYNYDVVAYKNGSRVSSKKLYETSSGKIQIGSYTNKSDIIDSDGNAIKYTLDIANFKDTVRKDNTYYVNSVGVLPNKNTNTNEVVYDLNIRYLKEKYDNVELIKKLQKEITDKNAIIDKLQLSINQKDTQIKTLTEKIAGLEKQAGIDKQTITDLNNELQKLKTEKETIQNNLNKVTNELKTLQTENAKTLSENADLKKQVEDLNTKIANLNAQISAKDKTIGELNTKISNLEKQITQKDGQIKTLEGKVSELDKKDKANTAKIAELDGKIKTLEGQIQELETNKQTNEKTINDLKEKVNTLTTEKGNLEKEKNNLSNELQNVKQQLEEEKGKNTTNTQKIADLEKKLNELQGKYDALSSTSDKCTEDTQKLQEQVSNLTQELEKKKKEIEGLNNTINGLTEQNSEKDTRIQNLEKEIQNAKDTKVIDDKKIKDLEAELGTIKKEKQDIQNSLNEANKKVTDFEQKNKDLIQENSSLKEQLKTAQENIASLNSTIQEKDAKIKELETSISNLQKEIEEKNNKIKELEGKVSELDKKDKTNTAKIAELDGNIQRY